MVYVLYKLASNDFFNICVTATLTILPNPIGSILGGVLMDLIGRKLTLQLIFIPFALAWVIIAFSYSVEMIYIGTFINGIATGNCS